MEKKKKPILYSIRAQKKMPPSKAWICYRSSIRILHQNPSNVPYREDLKPNLVHLYRLYNFFFKKPFIQHYVYEVNPCCMYGSSFLIAMYHYNCGNILKIYFLFYCCFYEYSCLCMGMCPYIPLLWTIHLGGGPSSHK